MMVRVLAMVGPTASGKSDLAYMLAEKLGGEIVSCDSVQVYRGFDIGSAKPTKSVQRQIPHHLIDIVNWDTPFDAAAYCRYAHAAIANIAARGRLPVICGGTGLYLRALAHGLIETPPVDAALRAQLTERQNLNPTDLWQELLQLDPQAATLIDRHNPRRVLRALEICLQTGKPVSALRRSHGFHTHRLSMQVVYNDCADTILRARIAARAEQMYALGLLTEVEQLLAQQVAADCKPMQSVGYREAVQVLLQQMPKAMLIPAMIQSTWQYARRQRTWWRRQTTHFRIDTQDNKAFQTTLQQVLKSFNGDMHQKFET